jgi:hypothetical protein
MPHRQALVQNRAAVFGAVIACGVAGVLLAAGPKSKPSVATVAGQPTRLIETDIRAKATPRLRTVMTPVGDSRGGGTNDGGIAGNCPPVIRTHSAANFQGGAFTIQAGFAEGEIAAASYTIPAEHFPITLNTWEMIFATQAATVQTTTMYTVMVWEGTPNTGNLVESFSSDGTILPHLIMGVGTNGVNVQVSVDPGDPEQVIVQNNGSNTFSIGYRIDDHNNEPANPCLASPPTNSNAFPTTDNTSSPPGLAQPTQNWIFMLNCGFAGCANWHSFQSMSSICRPNGDWNIRATYTPFTCTLEGACCVNGVCSSQTEANCALLGGSYRGDNTTCNADSCKGACCVPATQNCTFVTQNICGAGGGSFQGVGTSCAQAQCFVTGACCLPSGQCLANSNFATCTQQGGAFNANETCVQAACPQPEGACCIGSTCLEPLNEADCETGFGGTWQGFGSICEPTSCQGGSPCPADIAPAGGDNQVNVQDLLAVIGAWGACPNPSNCPADIAPAGGDDTVNVQDLLAVIGAWGACPP